MQMCGLINKSPLWNVWNENKQFAVDVGIPEKEPIQQSKWILFIDEPKIGTLALDFDRYVETVAIMI